MTWLNELWRRVHYLFHRKQMEDDLLEEMRLHLDLRSEEKIADGIHSANSARQARIRFGNISSLRERSHDVWGWTFWESLLRDVRYGVRALAANPGFTATAVLSLALGIGANTAIFSILNAVMLRSLPIEDPHQLVVLELDGNSTLTYPLWAEIHKEQKAFSGTLAYADDRFDMSEGGESHYAQALWVNGDFFRVLGIPALQGRMLTPQDDLRGGGHSGPVAVISYAFWKGHFAGDPDILGKNIRLNRHTVQIIGIVPPWFTGLDVDKTFDISVPFAIEPLFHGDRSMLDGRSTWWITILGRLFPGETRREAQDRMNAIAGDIVRATLPDDFPKENQEEYLKQLFTVKSAATGFSETEHGYKQALFVLMAVVALVLLIACANVANLLLGRSAARQREISMRLALGAARARVLRQLLTESFLLSAAGTLLGFLFAIWSGRGLVHLLSTSTHTIQLNLKPDFHLFAFTAGITLLTTFLFGLAPALRATKLDTNQVLKENSRGTISGTSRTNLRHLLVVGQVSLSLILLIAAGLFVRTFQNILAVNPGFNPERILLMRAQVQEMDVPQATRNRLFDDVLDRISRLPGVLSAARSVRTPISSYAWNDFLHPEGYVARPTRDDTEAWFNRISPGYFRTMSMPILLGRDFSSHDTLASPKVIILSESAARHFWGEGYPVGKKIGLPKRNAREELDFYEVIGVVKDTKYRRLNETPRYTAYLPSGQDDDPRPFTSYEIKITGGGDGVVSDIRNAVLQANSHVVLEFQRLDTQIDDSLVQQRLIALLSAAFGILALVLATIGLYGVLSYAVARRRGEIGIRMALGARQTSIIWLVLRSVALMLAAGIVLGVCGSLAAGRIIQSFLFGVRAADPLTLCVAIVALILTAAIASYAPAHRAVKMNPMTALRDE